MALEEFIRGFILDYGVISVFILVLLEYASFPMPSEVVLPLMGIIHRKKIPKDKKINKCIL